MLPVLSGYAALWHSPTLDHKARGETVTFERGAFSASIAGRHPKFKGYRVLATINHDLDKVFAAQGDGLELFEDGIGLAFRIHPWETDEGLLAVEAVRGGLLPHASVQFLHGTGRNGILRDGVKFTRIQHAGLIEVSLCCSGANPRTITALWE